MVHSFNKSNENSKSGVLRCWKDAWAGAASNMVFFSGVCKMESARTGWDEKQLGAEVETTRKRDGRDTETRCLGARLRALFILFHPSK